MSKIAKILLTAAIFSLATGPSSLFGFHSYARFFNFFERPEDYLYNKGSFLDASAFYTQSDAGFRRGGGASSIPELFGNYDLRDMIFAVGQTNPTLQTQIKGMIGDKIMNSNAQLRFRPRDMVHSTGLTLRYAYGFSKHVTVGAWLPIMRVSASGKYFFDRINFFNVYQKPTTVFGEDQLVNSLDAARRALHDGIGFDKNYWDHAGLGDLDMYVRYNRCLDHQFYMRSLDMGFQLGVIAPTGTKISNDNPFSLPFMGDGHWSMYIDWTAQFELKQDWKVGGMISGAYHFSHSDTRRVPVYKEPSIYSPLIARVEVDPGQSAKFSAFIIKENLADGLHAQCRYSYTRHARDRWYEARSAADIASLPSYLSRSASAADKITQQAISDNIFYKENLSKFRSHYITMQLMYNTADAQLKWRFKPEFYALYDLPINGSAMCKTHNFSVGAQLHF